jgi:hypothetical protein
MRRFAIRLVFEVVRLAFAVVVGGLLGAVVLQGPLEKTCPPSEANPPEPSGLCAGLSALYGAGIGIIVVFVLSLIAEWSWRRRRKRRLAN